MMKKTACLGVLANFGLSVPRGTAGSAPAGRVPKTGITGCTGLLTKITYSDLRGYD